MGAKNYSAAASALRTNIAEDLRVIGRYDQRINDALDAISSAEPGSNRAAAAAALGGVLRSIRSKIRMDTATEIMRLLEITPSVHVARAVMLKAFNQSVSGDSLVRRFGDPKRSAANKVMHEAREILESERAEKVCKSFAAVYSWFSESALPERVSYLKQLQVIPEQPDKQGNEDNSAAD